MIAKRCHCPRCHCSVRVAPLRTPATGEPRARQRAAPAHETENSTLFALAGCGVTVIRQLAPAQASARPAVAPDLAIDAPTAMHDDDVTRLVII